MFKHKKIIIISFIILISCLGGFFIFNEKDVKEEAVVIEEPLVIEEIIDKPFVPAEKIKKDKGVMNLKLIGEDLNSLLNKSTYGLFPPLELKISVDKHHNINGSLSNEQINIKINGQENQENLDLRLTGESIELNALNFPVLQNKIKKFISGDITPTASIKIDNDTYKWNGTANIKFSDMTFGDLKYSISDFNYDMDIDSFSPLEMKGQTLKSSFLGLRNINLFKNSIRFLAQDDIFYLQEGKSEFGKGTVSIEPFYFNSSDDEIKFVVKLKNCKIQEVLNLSADLGMRSTGSISGRFTVLYDLKNNLYSIENGALFSGEGVFTYPEMNIKNFNFDTFQLFFNKEYAKKGKVKLLLRGYDSKHKLGGKSALALELSRIFEKVF